MVVAVGLTLTLPSTSKAPVTFVILTAVALVVVHSSVVDWPAVIVVASAVKVSITGPAGFTVTGALDVTRPPGPRAVSV